MTNSSPIASSPIGATDDEEEVAYLPVSRIHSGGSIPKPADIPVLGVDLVFDSLDWIAWDDDSIIAMEA
jgi:hypothetical protein